MAGQDWHFLLYTLGVISKCSKLPLAIDLTDDALKGMEEYHTLCKGVRKVLGVIVGLLKDSACADKSPESKNHIVRKYNHV
ncbi:hypothetical protein RhiirA1_425936 [Rhizophagus irregularis]|uniref:Uncharacterized protein n=1 Tax=Rhizophagus irregularis TaxID=588596 RepID=A0A2N0RAU5_9GLOM|nr:hypothetical protein RhiirA1_425936 [Rhizophagus irregularis]